MKYIEQTKIEIDSDSKVTDEANSDNCQLLPNTNWKLVHGNQYFHI